MAEIDRDAVCVLIPTLNEAATIESVVEGFRDHGYNRVLVMDGGSEDGTADLASAAGARVHEQSGSGKGQAVREALTHISAPYILMVDGDGTYQPADADRMVRPLVDGTADHVIGNRFADLRPGSMTRLNQIGNRLINRAYRIIHHRNHHDILSGYRAFTSASIDQVELSADGFGIETELAVACVRAGIDTTEVPITYHPRPEASQTNLRPIRDGGIIILTLYRLAKTNNPLFYFGSLGAMALLLGLTLAGFVGYRWWVLGVTHEVLALVAGVGILLGIQLFFFGVLSDLVVSLHREQRRRIDRLEETLSEAESERKQRTEPIDESK